MINELIKALCRDKFKTFRIAIKLVKINLSFNQFKQMILTLNNLYHMLFTYFKSQVRFVTR